MIHLNEELGEYEKTEIIAPIELKDIPEQYRDIQEGEILDTTEELDSVLSF